MKANIILKASLWILTMTAIIMNGDILTEKRTINGKTTTNHWSLDHLSKIVKGNRKKICKSL